MYETILLYRIILFTKHGEFWSNWVEKSIVDLVVESIEKKEQHIYFPMVTLPESTFVSACLLTKYIVGWRMDIKVKVDRPEPIKPRPLTPMVDNEDLPF